jgi:SH3-like domain-containing protein
MTFSVGQTSPALNLCVLYQMATVDSNAKQGGTGVKNSIMKLIWCFSAIFLLFAADLSFVKSAAFAQGTDRKVGPSGNPLPRFVSLRGDRANMRTGPGLQYPIDWSYSRRTLPLEIIDEHGRWRKVRDHDGTTGWMLVSLLTSSKRYAMVRGRTRTLFAEMDLASPVLATADAGVIGELVQCESIWCQMRIGGRKAWIERRHLWGVYPNEVID